MVASTTYNNSQLLGGLPSSVRPRGSKLEPHWQSAAVPPALHVEAEHSGGRRLLRGAGVHFVPAFGLPFQTKTPLDSLTYRGARDTWTHTRMHKRTQPTSRLGRRRCS